MFFHFVFKAGSIIERLTIACLATELPGRHQKLDSYQFPLTHE